MKRILFVLMLYGSLFAQIHVVGDTTDLKLYDGSGIVLLEKFGAGNTIGGGLFHRIDSTYAEGVHAFDYPSAGLQWARINLIDQYLTLGASDNDVGVWNTNKYNPISMDSLLYLLFSESARLSLGFGVDSTKGVVLAASDSTLWRIKVSPTGAVSADSTGLN